MKMRMWVFLLAVVLVFGMAGCGTETAPADEVVATPETEEETPILATPENGVEVDPNGDAEEPSEISMGTLTDSLEEGSEDWYTFDVPDGHILRVTFTTGDDAENLHVRLLDPDQNRVWQERYIGPTVSQSTRQVMSSSSGGMYYIEVSGGYGEYTLELATESQDDAGSGGDAGDRVADALEVEVGQSFSGEVGDFDEEDWYAFEVAAGESLSVTFSAGEDAENVHVELLDPEQNRLWRERYMGAGETRSIEVSDAVEGTYYLQVSGGSGRYTVEVE